MFAVLTGTDSKRPHRVSFVFNIFYVHGGVCTPTYTQRTEEGIESSEVGVTDRHELPDLGAGNQTQALWKSSQPLTSISSLPNRVLYTAFSRYVFSI